MTMSEAKLTFLGPVSGQALGQKRKSWRERISWPFMFVVVVPTFAAAIYYASLATPRYVSEARFIVRAQTQQTPSPLGVALQGVGLGTAQTDAFAVHEYIKSRDALKDLQRRYDIRAMLSQTGVDPFSGVRRPWEGNSREALYKGFQRFVVVGHDSTNGMSTLRVEAFSPQDATTIANGLLDGGENLVNRLNRRATETAVVEAEAAVKDAQEDVVQVQAELTRFRTNQRFIDPANVATETSEVLGGLLLNQAELSAEKQQLESQAPQSPQLASLNARLRAIEGQIEAQRQRIAGTTNSLAPQVGDYELLVGRRELAARNLASATATLNSARQDARRQQLYLERVVSPSLADKPTEPKRLLAVLTVFGTLLLIYGVAWLIWTGVKEHRQ
ncbi:MULTISPECIES: chain-length determining protein [unclassified Brevundimonas]|uniref:chain-length determining protein n=1 Tax=unclassified Brevundimonas TaxID=2622653 RepID=UPI002004FE3C|nr:MULTISPECIES: chain-length determining protein [unclassified Brevundimonas]MCW0046913.1 chain-length determining protein [Brevundimonas sp. BT-123]